MNDVSTSWAEVIFRPEWKSSSNLSGSHPQLHLTLKMTSAQFAETSINVILARDVFDMLTATGNEHFASQDSTVSWIFKLISCGEMFLSNKNVVVWRQVKREDSSLPVAVGVVVCLIKLPIPRSTLTRTISIVLYMIMKWLLGSNHLRIWKLFTHRLDEHVTNNVRLIFKLLHFDIKFSVNWKQNIIVLTSLYAPAPPVEKMLKEFRMFVRRRQCGPEVRALSLRSGDPGFTTHSDHLLNLILVVPGSTSQLHL